MSTIANEDKIGDINKIKLEVHDNNNKYFMMPFQDVVLIETDPVVSVKMTEEKDELVEEEIQVKLLGDEDGKPIKRNSRISKFLEDK